jgi:hypothetical protein
VTQLWPADSAGTDPSGRPAQPPSTVKWAAVLLILSAWLIVLPVISLVYGLINLDDQIQRAAQRTAANADQINTQRLATQIITGVGIGMLVVLAATLFFPALGLRRGSRGSRVAAIFATVLSILACGAGTGLSALGSQDTSQTSAFETELTRLQAAETPAWVDYATLSGALVPVLAAAATVALLTGSARQYFNPRATSSDDGYQHGGFFAYPAPYSARSGAERAESKHAAGDSPRTATPATPATPASPSNVTSFRDRREAIRPWDQPAKGERGEATRPWDQPATSDRAEDPPRSRLDS